MSPESERPEPPVCRVYRSSRHEGMYLYLAGDAGFEDLPEALMGRFGRPEFVMELALHPGRRLAREDVDRVLENLRTRGFHLQMPPEVRPRLYDGEGPL